MQSSFREPLDNDIRLALHVWVLGRKMSSVLSPSPGKVKMYMAGYTLWPRDCLIGQWVKFLLPF